jgi:hypothetical protein
MMPSPYPSQKTSVFHAFDYLIGLVVFGFGYGIFSLVVMAFFPLATSDSLYDYANFVWAGALVVYLVFGPFWFWNQLKER